MTLFHNKPRHRRHRNTPRTSCYSSHRRYRRKDYASKSQPTPILYHQEHFFSHATVSTTQATSATQTTSRYRQNQPRSQATARVETPSQHRPDAQHVRAHPPARPDCHLQLSWALPRRAVDPLERRPVFVPPPVGTGKRLQLDALGWQVTCSAVYVAWRSVMQCVLVW